MSNRIPFLLSLPFLLLQGCLSVYTEEFIRKSESRIAPFAGPIHLPASDTVTQIQATFDLEGGPEGRWANAVNAPGPVDLTSESRGASPVSMANVRIGTEWSFLYRRWLRIGMGASGSNAGGGVWLVTGMSTPGSWPLEALFEAGGSNVKAQADWRIVTHRRDPEDELNDSIVEFSSTRPDELRAGFKLGLHFGRRAGGPWIEAGVGSQDLFDAPTTKATWQTASQDLAVGWMQRTSRGIVTAYVRGRRLGPDFVPSAFRAGEWNPSVGIQWTGEVRLGP